MASYSEKKEPVRWDPKEEEEEASQVESSFDEAEFEEMVAAAKASIAADADNPDITPIPSNDELDVSQDLPAIVAAAKASIQDENKEKDEGKEKDETKHVTPSPSTDEEDASKEPPAKFEGSVASSSVGSLEVPVPKDNAKPAERSEVGSPWTLTSDQADISTNSPWETVEAASPEVSSKKPPPLPPSFHDKPVANVTTVPSRDDDSSIGSGSMGASDDAKQEEETREAASEKEAPKDEVEKEETEKTTENAETTEAPKDEMEAEETEKTITEDTETTEVNPPVAQSETEDDDPIERERQLVGSHSETEAKDHREVIEPPVEEQASYDYKDILEASKKVVAALLPGSSRSDTQDSKDESDKNPWLVTPDESMASAVLSLDEKSQTVNPPTAVQEESTTTKEEEKAVQTENPVPQTEQQPPKDHRETIDAPPVAWPPPVQQQQSSASVLTTTTSAGGSTALSSYATSTTPATTAVSTYGSETVTSPTGGSTVASGDDSHRYTSMDEEEHETGGKQWQNRDGAASSLMAKTRSRARVDMIDTSMASGLSSAHHVPLDDDDNAFILNTALAKKRVRVVQLLIIGLVGIGLGFFGSIYVQSTCHFLNTRTEVGSAQQNFNLHYGFWKYAPIDSAFDGYSYCTRYDDSFVYDAPYVSRIAGVLASICGTYSLAVLWYYLITGRARLTTWVWAVRLLVVAGFMQAFTFFFFGDDVCQFQTCSIGPGAGVSIAITIGWFIMAHEMNVHTPVSSLLQELNPTGPGENQVAGLEMTDFEDGAKNYVKRLTGKADMPTLNEIQRRRGDTPRTVADMEAVSLHSPTRYRPPPMIV